MSTQFGRLATKGAAWSMGGQGISIAIKFASTSILARLVSPDAFGMVAMATAVIGFGELFRDFGLTNAVIQAPTVSQAEKSNLFWINTVLGLILSVAMFSLAGSIADFYEHDEISKIIRVLSFSFLLNGLATQPRANLIRDLRMRTVATIDVVSVILSLALSIGLAAAGMGVWAIVAQQLGRIGIGLFAAMLADGLNPGLPHPKVSIKGFLQFGLLSFAARIPGFLSMSLDTVLIGRYFGADTVGFYSRANSLAQMPSQQMTGPLSQVMLPMLSRLSEDPVHYNRAILQSQTVLATVSSIGYPLLIVFAPECIRVALGPGWTQAVAVFQVLALVGMIDSVHNLNYWIFISKGIPHRHLQYSLIGRPVLVVMVVIAAPIGIIVVAWSLALWIFVAWVFGTYWAGRTTAIPVKAMLITGTRSFAMSFILIVSGLLSRNLLVGIHQWVNILLTLLTMLLILTITIILFRSIRHDVQTTVGLLKHFTEPSTF